ncbi:MAG: response regulator [Patescibacteria group bacterium]
MDKKILLIEDDDLIRQLYADQMRAAGLEVFDFPDGKSGLAALRQQKYDLILLDIMLPDINGLEILKQIKQDNGLKSIPVVLLTNLGQDTIIKEGFKLGADAYLIKLAYNTDQIITEVKNILAGQMPQKPQELTPI